MKIFFCQIMLLFGNHIARLAHEMCELSQHSLQGQFVHVVGPRKLNVSGGKVNCFLIFSVFSAFLFAAFMICLERGLPAFLSVLLVYLGEECCRFTTKSWKVLLACDLTGGVGKLLSLVLMLMLVLVLML